MSRLIYNRLNVHTKWAIYLDGFYNVMTHKMSAMLKPFFGRYMRKQTYAVGVGRHSNEEVGQMMVHDLEMLSTLLGMFEPLSTRCSKEGGKD